MSNIISIVLTILGALSWGLLLGGISRTVTARIHGRMGPRVTQNFIDTWKLFKKKSSIHHGGCSGWLLCSELPELSVYC